MKHRATSRLGTAVLIATLGCATEVETTDDSVRIETEVPKIERGEEPVDLDPRTDEDVDIDTPAPGDR